MDTQAGLSERNTGKENRGMGISILRHSLNSNDGAPLLKRISIMIFFKFYARVAIGVATRPSPTSDSSGKQIDSVDERNR